MEDFKELIPVPTKVRERLAANIKEGRLLRSLLRLSIEAAKERLQLSISAQGAPHAESLPQTKGGGQ